ncbi:hypothetical protein [Falsiruegeria litorea]|nr:hypothetical protein [Falsiruegeria litorea]
MTFGGTVTASEVSQISGTSSYATKLKSIVTLGLAGIATLP